jgi:dephospho-CoA kinase
VKIIGITGNIASGKSTISTELKNDGYAVFDADLVVQQLFQTEEVIKKIKEISHDLVESNKINRKKLSNIAFQNSIILKKLESILHPKVKESMNDFIISCKNNDFIFLDIPLLFEGGAYLKCDYVIFLKCSALIQKQRFLARNNGDEKKLSQILAKQKEFQNKEKKSNFVIDSSGTKEETYEQVKKIIRKFTINE